MSASLIALSLSLVLTPQASEFRPAPLSLHQPEVGYDDLKYGMTDSEIKRKFRTTRGAIVPEALRLSTGESSAWIVDALLDGRGGNAKVRAVRLVPRNLMTLSSVPSSDSLQLTRGWAKNRFTDYNLAADAERGILIHLNGDGQDPRVTAVYLGSATVMKLLSEDLVDEPTEIQPVPDPGARWDRMLEIGRTDVQVRFDSTNRPGSLSGRFPTDLEDDLSYELRRRNDVWFFERGTQGRITFRVSSGRFKENGEASFSVSATLESPSPYGTVSVSASQSGTFRDDYRNRISRLVDRTLEELKDNAALRVRRLGPPRPESFESEVFVGIMELLTNRRAR
ncbi:MAG: hypothetical protein MUC92_07210 [Fimbriimonadaceae bacterium]|jgi:hypothetical protein|nr:hypothetical protein [Fimbriimonadaceae bacterium]